MNQVLWDPTPGGNVDHIAEHDLTMDDVEHVLENYTSTGVSRSAGRACSATRLMVATFWWPTTRSMKIRSCRPPHTKCLNHECGRKQMAKKKLKRVVRPFTAEERERLAKIREGAANDFPPSRTGRRPAAAGIPAKLRAAREAKGWSWYAAAQAAGISNQSTVRDIELGKDVKLSNLESLAKALGLELDLVPAEI